MVFGKYHTDINYELIADELKNLSSEMAESIRINFNMAGPFPGFSVDDSIRLLSDAFYAYGAVLVREKILYKLEKAQPSKEVDAMVEIFAAKKNVSVRHMRDLMGVDSSVMFKKRIVTDLGKHLVPGYDEVYDIFGGFFYALEDCVDDWMKQ